ncbi:hypothetical protein [Lysinibacillus parviboronicapiens]|uniref:hypothetical protein n=2 Tax=Lysinibacillus parviboronicapiens TaxID=436516 RepID=UPI000D3533F5|nr:hypothetical protein [Lysinibacillus parviboronicapiens]
MKIVNYLSKFYTALKEHEKLLRLLYYMPKNHLDDPLDESKMDISQLPEKDLIINNLLVVGEKTSDLIDSHFSRICLYTGPRTPQKHYLKSTNQFTDHPYSSTQQYIFDIYTPVAINNIDFRLDWLGEMLNEVLFQEDIEEFGDMRFHSGIPIVNTPEGFVGYRWIYIIPSGQGARGFQS